MYWIGLIVGVIVTVIVEFAFFLWCMYVTETSWADYRNLVGVNRAAIENRESTVQVYHDGECIFETVFEEIEE